MSQVLNRYAAGAEIPFFDPAVLFEGGQEGVWLDFSDITTMFQDSAGTVAAVVDQPVGRVADKSGRGHHATSSGSARPILRQTSGKYWLDFPQTAYLDIGATAAETDFATVSCLVGSYSVANTRVLIGKPHTSTQVAPYFRWVIYHGVSNAYAVRINGTEYTAAAAWTLSANHLITYLSAGGKARMDGVDSVSFPAAALTYPNATVLRIGANVAAGELFYGRVYGVILVARAMSAAEIVDAETWLQGKYVS